MAEDADLTLLPGEEIMFQGPDVTYLSPFKGPVPGRLVVTSYQFAFVGNDRSTVKVPLGTIEKVDKVGGTSSRGEHSYGLEIFCKDLRSIRIAHRQENHSRRSAFEALQMWAFPMSSGKPFFNTVYKGVDGKAGPSQGWQVYDFTKEMERQGVPNEHWRISTCNSDYSVCSTYPPLIAVPKDVTDEHIRKAAQFRSRGRLPALSWMHPHNKATITRCSQPKVGFSGKRSADDESLLQSIRQQNPSDAQRMFIVDARPKRNAVANQAKGMGYEYDSNYANCDIQFLSIHNIHVMRGSLKALRDLCTNNLDDTHWLSNLESTNWLKHVKAVLSGAVRVVNSIERDTSVLVHCSDGWDRTAQLTSLSMLMLDPYFRTIEGFEVLVEKEWLEFGHKFAQRLGHGDSKHGDDQRSPVFLQFLDCTFQILNQFPCAFEFNEELLCTIADHMYSCLFGTFMLNNHQARVTTDLHSKTHSLWDLIAANKAQYTNPLYAPAMHAEVLPVKSNLKNLTLWKSYYLRWVPSLRPQESVDQRTRELQALCLQLEKECQVLEAQAS